jgi:hypothetical protein
MVKPSEYDYLHLPLMAGEVHRNETACCMDYC